MNLEDIKKPEHISLTKSAAFMEISYNTLYRMVKDGKIRSDNIAKTGTKPIYALRPEYIQEYYDSLQDSNNRTETVNE